MFWIGFVTLSTLASPPWQTLEPGLEYAEYRAPTPSIVGDSQIRVLRIDARYFEFRLLNRSAVPGAPLKTAREWAQSGGLIAAINPSMFQKDMRRSVSLMKSRAHTNHGRLSKDMTLFAFDPKSTKLPPVRIIDRQCDSLPKLRRQYQGLVQSIRMISCRGKNVWKAQRKRWSIAAIATDHDGKVLFIHSRSPYSVHQFTQLLQKLPLNIDRAMYAEGGPEAQLFIRSASKTLELVGSYATGHNENDDNEDAWPIPNVLGIVRK